ncbi:VOC family protein [Paenibacillus alkalitolerans]|uniref:VOC family protein n=1 Tax=Paenibacillus alkalitolerans TaxID=2799335 RepID=UPI0018F31AFC|nr:VOC family protein [Paenibacillus alkalitolerans]
MLVYEDVNQAVDWLCNIFGFTLRLRIGNHRAQLMFGDGAVIVSKRQIDASGTVDFRSHSLLVRVEDADAHCERARKYRAQIEQTPKDFPYGERQYTVVDIGGHLWTFSQSFADVAPEEWGGTLVQF